MSLDLTILQKPLDVTETHSDHTWNVALNGYSAYTNIRLVVDVYKNPYSNDLGPGNTTGTNQETGKAARLLIPINEYGNCIFNVETIIRNFCKANARNLSMIYNPLTTQAENDPYLVSDMNVSGFSFSAITNQATINNGRPSSVGFSNGFNGGYEGYENIVQVNEYRLIFGVQYTSGKTTTLIIDDINYNVYDGWDGEPLNPASASTQPYGVMIWPGVQDNKIYGVSTNIAFTSYYQNDPSFNFHNTKVYSYAMNTGVYPYNKEGLFMATFGDETLPMTAFGGDIMQTRWRTHYYNCPIVLGFMYGENPMYNNSNVISGVTFLQKTLNNGQMNYDTSQTVPISYTPNPNGYFSFLGQRIAYAIFKKNPNVTEMSDVAIYLSSGTCDPSGADRVSEIVQYKMVDQECFNDPYSFLFLTRQGVWDTYTFTKKSNKTYQPERKTYSSFKTLNSKVWNRQSYDSNETVYYGVAEENFIFDSGFVYQNDREVIEEMLLSPYLFMIMNNYRPEQNETEIYPYLIPCLVLNKEVQVFQQKYQRIYQYTLEVKQTPYRKFDLAY
jgi:hypothetical protein